MPRNPHVGILPLYLELYDRSLPTLRAEQQPFLAQAVQGLEQQGLQVSVAPVACVREEFEASLRRLEECDIDLLVTLHLAYSPSLESVGCLVASTLPILMLDVTPDEDFGLDVDPLRLLYNHGIHGLQDLASMLKRHGRDYQVAAGHVGDESVMKRCADIARGAQAAREWKNQRILRIGEVFHGMGDFQAEETLLASRFGITVQQIKPLELKESILSVSPGSIEEEILLDRQRYQIDLDPAVHDRSVRLGLGLRDYLDQGGFTAFSMNFNAFDSPDEPIETVPFLECCKAMERGVGYAGEGDVLTAGLVGALERGFGRTTFTEIFCPDWKGNRLFLSHMGEVNPEVAAGKPRLYEKEFPFTPAKNPATLACAFQPGAATLVNLAPDAGNQFNLLYSLVTIDPDGTHPHLKDWIRAWIRPSGDVRRFLESYSQLGGTHHLALVPGDWRTSLGAFARILGFKPCEIG